ncbi:excalibur calcium-binding domain-containing protein [Streptomyces iconiensis]|uniref:Excalibur calcium-binding domain-containing protein n=1 Tax=Streptomyces iconiensis TaxID=1384038 RepID=A0ABT7A9E4_9ACTN|nr:excalibur calcium-binding domain-containing protein [Streptomyces iconiensis]MDJ1137946.1 excalibur calcium-binding domain-containing protein [Streptomyces iconiensis]
MLALIVLGTGIWVSCSGGDEDTAEAKPRATKAAKAEWRLEEHGFAGQDEMLWTDMDKSVRLDLLAGLSAEDRRSGAVDDLDDDDGLTARDVRISQLGASHGVVSPAQLDGTAIFTPTPGFEGEATVTYKVKLKGHPETAQGEATVTVELSPGGQAEREYANCAEARADDATPVHRGDPGYGEHLDREGDGIGCEWG